MVASFPQNMHAHAFCNTSEFGCYDCHGNLFYFKMFIDDTAQITLTNRAASSTQPLLVMTWSLTSGQKISAISPTKNSLPKKDRLVLFSVTFRRKICPPPPPPPP